MGKSKSSGSSQRDGVLPPKGDVTNEPKIVRYEFDPFDPPPLSAEEQKQLAALSSMPDNDIDLSDMPEADDAFFERAVPGRFYRRLKQQLTLRIDADIIAWFKREAGEDGKGYQTRINQALRDYIAAKQRQDKKAG